MASSSTSSDDKPRARRAVESVGEKAQDVLKEDYGKARSVALHAVKSGSYMYPFKGIAYFLTHKSLWKPFKSRLGSYLTLSASVVGGMFALTYVPQLAVQVFVSGPFAVFTTVLLVLNESSAIINAVARGWLLQDSILDTFDGTLVARGATGVLGSGRELKGGRSGRDPIQRLGKVLKNPFERFGPTALIRYLMYLPLNFIPVVGTLVYLFVQGRNRGRMAHDRYYQLKQWSKTQKSTWQEKNIGPYTAFGLTATVLEMIPIVSIFFTYTNTVGAALWAADIEAASTSMQPDTAPSLRDLANKAEL